MKTNDWANLLRRHGVSENHILTALNNAVLHRTMDYSTVMVLMGLIKNQIQPWQHADRYVAPDMPVVNKHPTAWDTLLRAIPHVTLQTLKDRHRHAVRMYGYNNVMLHHLDDPPYKRVERDDAPLWDHDAVFDPAYMHQVLSVLRHPMQS